MFVFFCVLKSDMQDLYTFFKVCVYRKLGFTFINKVEASKAEVEVLTPISFGV